MIRLCYDIETGPLPMDTIKSILRYRDPKEPKLGNAKKRETIERKIKEWEEQKEERESEFYGKAYREAPLNPLTGRVFAVSYHLQWNDREPVHETRLVLNPSQEANAIKEILDRIYDVFHRGGQVVTYNGDSFDLPFLINRARVLRLDMSSGVSLVNEFGKTPGNFVDLAKAWMLNGSNYNRSYSLPKLEDLCSAFGIECKTGDWRGDEFHKKMYDSQTEAYEYLQQDVLGLVELAKFLAPDY